MMGFGSGKATRLLSSEVVQPSGFDLEVWKTARLLRSEAVNPTMHANGGLPLHELPKAVVLAVAQ